MQFSVRQKTWSRRWDSNPQPADYKSAALPIELRRQGCEIYYNNTKSKCQVSAPLLSVFSQILLSENICCPCHSERSEESYRVTSNPPLSGTVKTVPYPPFIHLAPWHTIQAQRRIFSKILSCVSGDFKKHCCVTASIYYLCASPIISLTSLNPFALR